MCARTVFNDSQCRAKKKNEISRVGQLEDGDSPLSSAPILPFRATATHILTLSAWPAQCGCLQAGNHDAEAQVAACVCARGCGEAGCTPHQICSHARILACKGKKHASREFKTCIPNVLRTPLCTRSRTRSAAKQRLDATSTSSNTALAMECVGAAAARDVGRDGAHQFQRPTHFVPTNQCKYHSFNGPQRTRTHLAQLRRPRTPRACVHVR